MLLAGRWIIGTEVKELQVKQGACTAHPGIMTGSAQGHWSFFMREKIHQNLAPPPRLQNPQRLARLPLTVSRCVFPATVLALKPDTQKCPCPAACTHQHALLQTE